MSVRATHWAWEKGRVLELAQGLRILLVRIGDHADNDGVCWPGNAGLADYTGTTERTVERSLIKLRDLHLLHRERRQLESGRGRRNDRLILHLDQPDKSAGCSAGTNPTTDGGPTRQSEQPPYTEEPSGTVKTPPNPPNSESAWEAWLADYHEVTGRTRVTGSATAKRYLAARLVEGRTLADLKLATRGCHRDKWWRDRDLDVPDIILQAGKIESFIERGRRAAGDVETEAGMDF